MAGRRLLPYLCPELLTHVTHTPWGGLCIADERGCDVLRDPDPVRRLRAFYRHAAAPAVIRAAAPLVRRVQYLEQSYGRSRHSEPFEVELWHAVYESVPPWVEIARAMALSGQCELPLEDALEPDQNQAPPVPCQVA